MNDVAFVFPRSVFYEPCQNFFMTVGTKRRSFYVTCVLSRLFALLCMAGGLNLFFTY